MYHLYHTTGFILGSTPIGESNRLFYIYTKQFGNIVAVAQGVRDIKSKLRFSLADFSMSNVSVVRGKDMWRITNAESLMLYKQFYEHEGKKVLVARMASLVKRLVPGEQQNEDLFITVENALSFLADTLLSEIQLRQTECIVNLQILATLGYGTNKPSLQKALEEPLSSGLLTYMEGKEKLAISEINEALKESQL